MEKYSLDSNPEAVGISRLAQEAKQKRVEGGEEKGEPTRNDYEKAKNIENAKNGTTANLIRSLDLSTQEGRDRLRDILSLWDPVETDHIRNQKIITSDGKELFPFKTGFDIAEGHLIEYRGGVLRVESLLKQYDSESKKSTKSAIIGHYLIKVSDELLESFGINPSGELFKSMDESDSKLFIGLLADSAEIASQSLNRAHTGSAIMLLNKMPLEAAERHPNYESLMELQNSYRDFFDIWNESFYRYFSNVIQNPNYVIDGKCDKSFLEDSHLLRKLSGECTGFQDRIFEKIIEKGKFCPEVDEEAKFLIAKIEKYKKILGDYCKQMSYAKPKMKE